MMKKILVLIGEGEEAHNLDQTFKTAKRMDCSFYSLRPDIDTGCGIDLRMHRGDGDAEASREQH
jgi:hypothetical protein